MNAAQVGATFSEAFLKFADVHHAINHSKPIKHDDLIKICKKKLVKNILQKIHLLTLTMCISVSFKGVHCHQTTICLTPFKRER